MGKLKRNICRFLIVLQIYGNVFQGAAHAADLADNNGIRNHIHLASFIDQTGNRRLALGTDGEDGRFTFLKSIDVPSSDTLDLPIKKVSTELLDGISDTTSVNGDDEDDDNPILGSDDGSSTTASIGGKGYFKSKTIVYEPQGNYLTLQGLKIYIDHDGAMRLEGRQNLEQDKHRKPIFLSSDESITLDSVMAHELILNAPQLNNYNKSLIGYLGIGSDESHFTNFGDMTIINLAEGRAFEVMDNHRVMTIDHGSVKARTFNNSGTFGLKQGSLMAENGTNAGWFKADSLDVGTDFTNEEDGVVITPSVSGAGELINLGKIETLEDLSLNVKNFSNSAGGSVTAKSITGLTNLKKFTNAEDASIDAGQALVFADNTKVINQGGMQANAMTLYGGQTTNGSSGRIDTTTLNLLGESEFENKGDIDVDQDLYLSLSGFTNKGGASLETGRIYGYEHLITLQNDSGSLFKVRDGPLALAKTTELINAGTIEAQSLDLSSALTTIRKSGIFRAPSINLTGVNPFTNHGHILANQKLKLNLPEFINLQRIESPSIDISQVTKLTNAKKAVIDAQGSDLSFGKDAKVINDGNLKARDYTFDGGSLAQGGRMDGRSLKLRDTAVTTTDDQSINLLGSLEESSTNSWPIRGKINAYHYIRVGDISLYGILNLVNFFEGRGTIHPGGKLITAHASFYDDLFNHGRLIAKQSASFTKGLTIAQSGFALLHDLRAAGDITNHGKLQIVGIQQPNQNAIKLTNSGIASFDANQTIPIVKKDQPQNLAWLDCEQATKADNYLNACFEFFNGTTAGKDFLKESAWLPSQITKVEPIEQYRLWYHEKYRLWYKNEYAEHLRQAVTAEKYQQWYQKVYQAPLEVSDLVTETVAKRLATISEKREAREQSWQVLFATTKPIKLQLDNQTTGKLTLRSGQFSFAGNNALVNEGTLTQDRAYVHWRVDSLDGLSGGIWQAKGSLGLLAYTGYNVGKLGVEENLHVSASRNSNFTDGIQVLEGLKQCKAQKVIVYADKIKNELTTSSPVKKSYPWPLELRINGDIDNSLEISAPELSIYAHNLKTLANLFASLGLLHLDVENLLDIEALIFGKKAISAKAQQFKIFGREDIPGRFNPRGKCYEHGVHYKLNGNGAYSEGRITLNISGLINNYYGTIQGSAYTITTPQLTNLAGLIAAIDPQANSQINVKDLKNLRDAQAGNQAHFECWSTSVLLNSDIGRPRDFGLPCAVGNHYHETSDEAVIASNGDLIINYHTLEMLISSITSYANLTLFANGVSLRNPGEGDMLPGTTTMTKRNWQINRIVGKAGIKADLGNANMATSMYGENIRVKAAWLTLQSLGLTPQQQIQIYDLVTECFNNNAYKNKNGNIDTVMPWKKSRAPKVMVVLGEKAIEQMGSGEPIKSQISLEAIEQQTKNLFFRFNRGIDGMGSNINDFFNNAFVRNHPDTISQQGTITLGGRAHKIEYLFNSTLTAQDVLKQGERDAFAYLQLKYEENLNTLKAEGRVSAILENASVKMVTNSESQGNRCLKGEQNLEIDVENDANIATSIEAINVLVKAKGNIIISSDIIHYQPNGGGDHWQVLDQTKIKAVKISLEAGKNINFKAVNTNSKVETRFIAKGHIIDETVGLSSKKTWQNEDGWHCYKSVQQQVSKHESGDKIISTANGAQHLFATNFKCKTLVLTGNDGVDLYEVHDITEYEHRSETAGNAFKNKVTKISQDKYHTGKGVKFDLEEGRVITNGDANFRNVGGKGKVTIELRGKKSNLKIFQGTNYRSHANFTKDEGTFWQSVELKGSNHSTFSEPDWLGEYIVQTKNFEDPVTGLFEVAEVDEDKFDEDSINSVSVNDELKKQVIIQQVHGQAISYMHRIKIDDGGEFVFENVHEKHEYYHEAQDGPTAAFAATFALAITALTYGAGADLGALVVSSTTATCGTTAAGILGGMATGAFMSVCAQTSMALLLNGGDPSKAAKSLVSKESFRNLIFSTVSGGIKGYMGKSPTGFINKLAFNLDRNIVESGLRLVMFNEKFDFISCLRNAGLDTVAEIGANKIGDRYENNKIDGPTRDIYHFGLAASIQSITDLSQNNGECSSNCVKIKN
jgi:hypothetical protein